MLSKNFSRQPSEIFSSFILFIYLFIYLFIFYRKYGLTFQANCFSGDNYMKCHTIPSGKIRKRISNLLRNEL